MHWESFIIIIARDRV